MATITLRPTTNYGTGSFSLSPFHTFTSNGASTFHECVDDVVADNDATFVQASSGDSSGRILFGYNSSSLNESDVINSITAYVVAADMGGKGSSTVGFSYESNTPTLYEIDNITTTSTWTTYQRTFTINPITTNSWTKSEIDIIKMGFREGGTLQLKVTQFYIVVDYTPDSGTLINVKPNIMFLETDD